MGNNVGAVILTDFLDRLCETPDLGERIRDAINSGRNDELPQGIRLLPFRHADHYVIAAIGGNRIQKIGFVVGSRGDRPVSRLRFLALAMTAVAEELAAEINNEEDPSTLADGIAAIGDFGRWVNEITS